MEKEIREVLRLIKKGVKKNYAVLMVSKKHHLTVSTLNNKVLKAIKDNNDDN